MAISIRNGKQLVFSVCGQTVKALFAMRSSGQATKRRSKYFDPGRSCDYSTMAVTTPCQLGLAYSRETWVYPTNTLSATVAFLLLPDTNLLPQAGITHYSQLLTRQHSTKLLLVFFFVFFFFVFLSRSKLNFKVPTTT